MEGGCVTPDFRVKRLWQHKWDYSGLDNCMESVYN